MGLLDKLLGGSSDSNGDVRQGFISSGRNKKTGGHDHRTNTGDNRTPSQKEADKSRRKD